MCGVEGKRWTSDQMSRVHAHLLPQTYTLCAVGQYSLRQLVLSTENRLLQRVEHYIHL